MYRILAMTALAMSVGPVTVMGAGSDGGAQTPGEEAPVQEDAQARAAARAVNALAERLKIGPGEISIVAVEPRTWSDSSMGCRQPGTVALTVITPGYAVSLSAQGREHRVHVSDTAVVVCDQRLIRRDATGVSNARGLDVVMERARQDLARRLGVEPSSIRLAGMQPHRWSDGSLGCPRAGETVQAGPVDGFKLTLRHAGRVYTYHTDRHQLRPCPDIDSR